MLILPFFHLLLGRVEKAAFSFPGHCAVLAFFFHACLVSIPSCPREFLLRRHDLFQAHATIPVVHLSFLRERSDHLSRTPLDFPLSILLLSGCHTHTHTHTLFPSSLSFGTLPLLTRHSMSLFRFHWSIYPFPFHHPLFSHPLPLSQTLPPSLSLSPSPSLSIFSPSLSLSQSHPLSQSTLNLLSLNLLSLSPSPSLSPSSPSPSLARVDGTLRWRSCGFD